MSTLLFDTPRYMLNWVLNESIRLYVTLGPRVLGAGASKMAIKWGNGKKSDFGKKCDLHPSIDLNLLGRERSVLLRL